MKLQLAGGLVAQVGEIDADALTLAEGAVLEAEAELDAFADALSDAQNAIGG
jgi:preprotein translocase subunit YajC